MDNNELDKRIKDKLNNKIEPSAEFEKRVAEMVEKKKVEYASNKFEKVEKKQNKKRSIFKLTPILSMAAAFVIIFSLGINMKNPQMPENIGNANLISIKAITPTNLESGILANNSEFLIQAEGENLNKETIQKSIYVEPALDYTIEKTANNNEYKLKFTQNIPDNTIVKLQYVKNQITKDSWAYQTSKKLSVTSTYPMNNEGVEPSKNTVIEIEFSYASIKDLEKYVKISPSVDGKWEHIGNLWRFTPAKELKIDTNYLVTVKKGLQAENQKLENNYTFNFKVYGKKNVNYETPSIDRIITAKPNEPLILGYNGYMEGGIEFGKVSIGKFADVESFIDYIENGEQRNITKQGDYKIKDEDKYIEFNPNLSKGHYIAIVKNNNGEELFNCPIQISDISAYAMETERDILVWAAQGNELKQDLNVEYEGKTVKTDKDGIAKLVDATDGSKTVKYVKINNEVIIGMYNCNTKNYPNGYIYTDRTLYKNTDTINVWGFVPKKLFHEKVDDEFYIDLDSEGKQKIKLDQDGTFTTKIETKNHLDSEDVSTLYLYYKDSIIASRNIKIENYELQNYNYEVIAKKDYGYIGEKFEFDVKVTHVTGLVVPNKKVTIKRGDYINTQKTNENGIAHFSFDIESINDTENKRTTPSYYEIEIYNGDNIEYTGVESYFEVMLLKRRAYTDQEYRAGNDLYKVTLYKLVEDKDIMSKSDIEKLYNGTYETKVDITLKENGSKRYITGYRYNEYTKENEPEYEWRDTNSEKYKIKTITSTNGVIEINQNELKLKKNTEDTRYDYQIELAYKDTKGETVNDIIYVNNTGSYDTSYIGYKSYWDGYFGFEGLNFDKYDTFRYILKENKDKTAIGEKINFVLEDYNEKEIENEGKVLAIKFKNNISKTEIVTSNKFEDSFNDEDFPGVKYTGAYFVNGRFYRMPVKYIDFDEENRKADIDISTDKEEYKPGEEVKVKVKTSIKGKAIKSTVNISVVNEATFAIQEDETNLLESIYSGNGSSESGLIPVYTFSTYTDYLKIPSGGEGGGGGDVRANFADTAHFQTITTNSNGEAEISFKLPDNVTTYRITAQSANENLEIGTNTKNITPKLDFFIQSVEPRGLKTADDVVLNATSISEAKYDVNYEFTIKELNKTLNTKGVSNSISTVNFGKLPIGTYNVIIKGKYEDQQDAIQYKFDVKESTQEVKNKTTINIGKDTNQIKPSRNPIVLEIYNKDMSKYVKYIDFIESTLSERLDTQIAYNVAQNIKNKYYNEENSMIHISISPYRGNNGYLKNLKNGKQDIVLTALINYYTKGFDRIWDTSKLNKNDNLFEYYLVQASKGETVLNDLLYLKEAQDITNYNKLITTMALEFAGDFQNAKDLYKQINFSEEELTKYQSLIAIVESFIAKENVENRIDKLIQNAPADEYLRFAILSYFQNNSKEIENNQKVTITSKNFNETFEINGMEVKTCTINNEDLSSISFETESQDLMVSYYYQTALENINDKNIVKDMKISIDKDAKVGDEITLNIDFESTFEGSIRIALPNSLRLAQRNINGGMEEPKFYIQNNHIDYITVYKTKKCKNIKLNLLVINDGKYKFENIVSCVDGTYHISNSLDVSIEK